MVKVSKATDKVVGTDESGSARDDLREKMVAINRVTKVVKGLFAMTNLKCP